MPAYTSPDNIQYPVSTDPVAPLETVFANQAQSTQNAITSLRTDWNNFGADHAIHGYRWTNAAARAAQTGMVAGDTGYQIDTTASYQYTGSAWTAYMPGSRCIIPTSVTGGTATGRGLVTSSSTSLIRLNGILTTGAVIVNYDVTTASASGFTMRLSSAGTDSLTGYDNQLESTVNATYAAAQTLNSAAMVVSGVSVAGRHVGQIAVWGGASASATMSASDAWSSANPATAASGRYRTGMLHRSAVAYDGLSFSAQSGNLQINSMTIQALGA